MNALAIELPYNVTAVRLRQVDQINLENGFLHMIFCVRRRFKNGSRSNNSHPNSPEHFQCPQDRHVCGTSFIAFFIVFRTRSESSLHDIYNMVEFSFTYFASPVLVENTFIRNIFQFLKHGRYYLLDRVDTSF